MPLGWVGPAGIVLQSRGVGGLELVRSSLPWWAVEAFAAATHLGDTAVLLGLAGLLYLTYDRRAAGFLLGTLFVGFAVLIAAKGWFALPRPPAEVQAVTAYGSGFPSGHALGATVGWGGLAVALDGLWSRRHRALVAGVVVGVVAFSRVAIGVHYLVDVVAGVAVGLVVLWLAVSWFRDEPLGLFGLAGGMGALAVALSGTAIESVVLLGATAGALVAWPIIEPTDRPFGRPGILATGGGAIIVIAAGAVIDLELALAFGAGGLLTAGVLLAPLARTRWVAE